MAGVVDRVGQAPADQRIDRLAIDRGRADGVAVVGVVDRQAGQGRRHQQVVLVEHALDGVVDLGADRVVAHEVDRRHALRNLDPVEILRREIGAMLAQQVDARRLEIVERRQAHHRDHAAPQVAELALRSLEADLDLLDMGAGLGEGLDRLGHHRSHARIDREDVEVRAVGDLQAADRAARRGDEVDRALEAVGIARIVAGDRRQRDGGVLDRAGERAFEEERKGAGEGIRPRDVGHPPERCLVAIDAGPRGRNADRAAAVGAFGQRQQPVGDRARAAARRAAGVLGDVEGIARRTEQVVVADPAEAHHRAVGLPHEDAAGLFDMLGEAAMEAGHEVLQRAHAAEGRDPARLEVEQVLDRHRHAMERAQRIALHHRALGLPGRLARIVEAVIDEGGDARIAGLDPRDGGVDHLDRRKLARADAQGQVGQAGVGELVGQRHGISLPPRRPARAASGDPSAAMLRRAMRGRRTPMGNRQWTAAARRRYRRRHVSRQQPDPERSRAALRAGHAGRASP